MSEMISTTSAASPNQREVIIETKGLEVYFDGENHEGKHVTIRALDGVDFKLHRGEIVALVGESGSGKTTMARVFSLIYKPTGGKVIVDGEDMSRAAHNRRRYYRNVQLIYQDPFASMNSLKKIRHIVGRVVSLHGIARGSGVQKKVAELLERVNLTPASGYINRYPTDLSGGQRQRVAIARALAVQPSIILADEPTSMLDASIRLEVLNLLADLRDTDGLSLLYITHDIASARYLSDRIDVMYGGRIIESGPTESMVKEPVHPYTELLIEAAPDPAHYKGSGHSAVKSSSTNAPVDNSVEVVGCRFANRCPYATDRCTAAPIPEYRSSDGSRRVFCVLAERRDDFSTTSGPSASSEGRKI